MPELMKVSGLFGTPENSDQIMELIGTIQDGCDKGTATTAVMLMQNLMAIEANKLIMLAAEGDKTAKQMTSIYITWNIEDVLQQRPDLSEEQARSVLTHLKEGHDPCHGINWETIDCVALELYPPTDAKVSG